MTGRSPSSPVKLLAAALGYAGEGFPVLPLREQGKRPLTRHGVKDATTNLDHVRFWWSRRPHANVGLAVQPGFIVLDIDNPEALQRLRAEDLSLPTTAGATTGRGQHLWFATGEAAVGNRVALFPDIDVRAPGGYVVAPPSIHPNGAIYRWLVGLEPGTISECPEWLLTYISDRESPTGNSAETWRRRVSVPVPEGRRNQTLAEVAGLLFRRLPADVAEELAYCWAQVKLRPPLPERELLQTINSIAGCELRRQRGHG